MILKQYYLGCLAHASYLLGDEVTREAVVVDPQRDVGQYLDDARQSGLQIKHVFLTHFHADFVAGHLELRDRVGASIRLGARAEAEYSFVPMPNGGTLDMGNLRLQVLETPGHTPEAISILVFDLAKDRKNPYAVLTGDTLFIGDVGRPDLMASEGVSDVDLAGMLYDTLHHKLLTLPDETLVYPGHGAGSLCGKNLSTDTVSTIGIQRQYNYALQPMSKKDFIDMVTLDQPEAPSYFSYDALLNRKERPTLEETLRHALKPLSLDSVLELMNKGVQVLDTRDPPDFQGAHIAGCLNVGLGGKFATWCGILLSNDRPIVVIADPGREEEAATRLGRIGFDKVAGYLRGSMQALEPRPDLLRKTERITASTLAELLEEPNAPLVLDVRAQGEHQIRAIPGSLNIPLNHLRDRWREVPTSRQVVVHCASGYRSSIGLSVLKQSGFSRLADLVGGLSAWEASRLPTVSGQG